MIARLQALQRALCILWVLMRFHVSELLPDTLQPKILRFAQRLVPLHPSIRGDTPPEARLRLALESLGPIFVKFGQLLATRRDVLPTKLAEDLAQLQESVTPFHGAQALIETTLGHPIGHDFSTFDPNSLAAASVAQVHAATLKDGTPVVIKIRRPGIEESVARDLRLLHSLSRILDRCLPNIRRFHIQHIVQQYDTIITNELDFRLEAVMQRTFGIPIDDIKALTARGVDLKHLSVIGVEIFFSQVFRHNFFHADMHPGNVHVDVSDPQHPRYISLDCAIVGSLSERDLLLLARKLLALLRRDFTQVARLMVAGHWVPPHTDTHALGKTLETLLSPLLNQSMAEIEFGPLLISLFQAARDYDLQALPQFMLLEKTLIHVEGLGKQLDPELDVFSIGQPLLEAWLREKMGPSALFHQLEKTLPRWLEQLPQLPNLLEDALTRQRQQQQYQLEQLHALAQNQLVLARYQRQWPQRAIACGAVLIGLFHGVTLSGSFSLAAASACVLLGFALLR
ncbi:MAG: AarF/UbiB family protein, partial [Gammaproteobacteria bacterium]